MTSLTLPQLDGGNLLTHSRMSCAKNCMRRHYYKYELGLRREQTATALRFGSAYHAALEQYDINGGDMDACIATLNTQYADVPAWADADEWHTEREQVAWLFAGHCHRYADDGFEVVATEQVFDLPLVNPDTGGTSTVWRMAGKIDRIVRLPDGRLAVQEYKTCGTDISPDSDYWARLRIDQQISLYMLAAQRLGYDVQTVIYDVTRKPTIQPRSIPIVDQDGHKVVFEADGSRAYLANGKPRQSGDAAKGLTLQSRLEAPAEYGVRLAGDIATRPEHYYARQEIPRLDADLGEFAHELWQIAAMLRESRTHGRWFRNTSACQQFGRCEYFEICTNGGNPEQDGAPAGFGFSRTAHPELTETETY